MHEGLKDFLTRPRGTLHEALGGAGSGLLYFIIDQSRQPNALARLYGLGEELTPTLLLDDTEYTALAASGPLWFSAPLGSALALLGVQLCQERQAGIMLRADDDAQALAHARWLVKVNDGSGGQSLATYYLPSFWAALAMTVSEEARPRLMGPWRSVYSPAASYLEPSSEQWLSWQWERLETEIPPPEQGYFPLPERVMPTYRTLRWVYWLDEVRPAFGSPTAAQLPQLLDNLELLVQQGIYEGRHLLPLAELIAGAALAEQANIMAILQSREEAFIKVEHLKALNAAS
jgi:hypothetical protein